jgi:hypothetical protein
MRFFFLSVYNYSTVTVIVERDVERFGMFSGFISWKLSIHMFSRVNWDQKARKEWYEMRRMSV